MAAKIRKGDRVEVISGAEKGKRGEVVRVLPRRSRAVVQGVAIAKHHVKPRGLGQPGGMQEQEASVHLSNLMLVDAKTDRPTRVGFRLNQDGSKVRIARRSGETVES
jgi:large subunit ribosomal protein L24